ncbi:MAG: PhnD/SsuA/transferrin family substrate-binding protein [Verrucomicrobiales bacterium]|nr:PhnD/SsuA/transferrin family substrate-binding protein [Verrucomicrobiales bacterium]
MSPVIVGAVLYDPKVSVIWDIIREFFESHGVPMDVRLFLNYDLQNEALFDGRIEVAWNSPLAWLDALRRSAGTCRAIAMRDTDRDRVSHLIVVKDRGIQSVEDLRGKTVAFGAQDSPQARLIPQGLLLRHGLEDGKNYAAKHFDLLVGLHGDHIGGEKEALLCLKRGEADASALIDLNWLAWTKDGTIDPEKFAILATTDRYDHCVFTVKENFPAEREAAWLEVLHRMSYDDPKHREMMDMEGLKKWEPGRTSGFAALTEACAKLEFFAKPATP